MSATYPTPMLQPFAVAGDKNTIPNTASPTPGLASYEEGWPPETRQPIQSGGVPPAGRDFNGLGFDITQHTVWQNAGGLYKFNATLAAFIGGYSKGMVLQDNSGLKSYRSLVDNNTVDFNTVPSSIGVQWEFYAGSGNGTSSTTINTTGGSRTLTTPEAQADIIIVTGALASASTIVFPAVANKTWKLINATSGAFGMVAKAPTGQSLTMSQGFTNTVFYDGTQLVFPDYDSGLDSPAFRGNPTAPTQASTNNSTRLATTAFAKTMDSPAFTGTPTVPTAAPNTNTDQSASCAFVQTAVSNAVISVSAQYVNGNFSVGSTGDLWTDTSASAFTITLPDPPIGRNPITFRDIFATWAKNNLTINPGTKTILGASGNLVCNASGRNFGLWYDTTGTPTWRLF